MPKAIEIATELRKLADALEGAESESVVKPVLIFMCDTKEQFLELAKILPRPLRKEISATLPSFPRVRLNCPFAAIEAYAQVDQNRVCILKEPARKAVYECIPLLSEIEEAGLGVSNG